MVKNSCDTQARFLAKSLAFLVGNQQSAFSQRKIYRKGREERKGIRKRKRSPQIYAR
jgi:hypothetical protein